VSESRRSGFTNLTKSVNTLARKSRETQDNAKKTDGRGRPGHGGQKGVDNRGVSKKTYPLSLFVQGLIEEIAQNENVPQADIVMAAAIAFYNAWRAGKVDLDPYRTVTYSEKQPWRGVAKLELPDEFGFFLE
jgi:hypothetical protein